LRAAIEHERAQLASGTCHRLLDVVPQSRLDQLIAAHVGAHRQRLFAPGVTLSLFVEQTLRADPACQDAVARYVSQRNAAGLSAAGLGTGSYCKARQRLPLALIEACAAEVAVRAEDALPTAVRWRGRRIWLIDGTEVSMPDTPTLQDTFPQSRSQAAGGGFSARSDRGRGLTGIRLCRPLEPWALQRQAHGRVQPAVGVAGSLYAR